MADTTIVLDTSLDVIDKYKELVNASLDGDSFYIRAKETITKLYEDSEMTDKQRAEIIAQTIAQMATGLSANSLNVALEWTAKEKELVLRKEELEYNIDLIKLTAEKTEQEVAVSAAEKRLKQAQLIRLYGTPVVNSDGDVIGLADDGKEYATIENIEEDTAGKAQAKAKVADDILTSAKNREVMDTQKSLYARQIVGFDDNKYQKLFDTQMTAWGLMFSSGMLTTKPDIIENDSVSALYDELTTGIGN